MGTATAGRIITSSNRRLQAQLWGGGLLLAKQNSENRLIFKPSTEHKKQPFTCSLCGYWLSRSDVELRLLMPARGFLAGFFRSWGPRHVICWAAVSGVQSVLGLVCVVVRVGLSVSARASVPGVRLRY
jgi:hypothetical protein